MTSQIKGTQVRLQADDRYRRQDTVSAESPSLADAWEGLALPHGLRVTAAAVCVHEASVTAGSESRLAAPLQATPAPGVSLMRAQRGRDSCMHPAAAVGLALALSP